MMDGDSKALTGVIAAVLIIVSALVIGFERGRVNDRAMAEMGYCQTTIQGYGSPVWQKCQCHCKKDGG